MATQHDPSRPLPIAQSADPLHALATLAGEIGAENLASDADALVERLAAGRFVVACIGQFKRGKSTLLNALVGDSVLPVGVVPVTSALTVLRHGSARVACVHYRDRRTEDVPVSQSAEYVSEAGNAHSAKGVAVVEVFVPSPLLASGMCLVDTPGIGSVSLAARDITRDFVPHIDAALVVLGVDPPISGEELRLVEQIAAETDRFVFVLNKADKITDSELPEVLWFTRKVLLERLERPADDLFEVSALDRLQRGTPTRDWARLERALTNLAGAEKRGLLDERRNRAVDRLSKQVLREIEMQRDALLRPLEESERRMTQLRSWLGDAERVLKDLDHLLAAEHEVFARALDDRSRDFLERAQPAAIDELAREISTSGGWNVRRLRAHAFEQAAQIARRVVGDWHEVIESDIVRIYQQATDRFVDQANHYLDRLAASEPALAELRPLEREERLHARRQFYFTALMRLTAGSPVQWMLDAFGPRTRRRQDVVRRASDYLQHLLETNTSRVIGDFRECLLERARRLQSEIRFRLTELVVAAERAAARARATHASGKPAVQSALEHFETVHQRVADIRRSLARGSHTTRASKEVHD